jgi:hypothetical protein
MDIGRPVPASVLEERAHGDRRLIVDCIGFAVAELLPHEYRGVYAEGVAHVSDAHRISRELFS